MFKVGSGNKLEHGTRVPRARPQLPTQLLVERGVDADDAGTAASSGAIVGQNVALAAWSKLELLASALLLAFWFCRMAAAADDPGGSLSMEWFPLSYPLFMYHPAPSAARHDGWQGFSHA